MTLEAKKKNRVAVYIEWHKESGVLLLCNYSWNTAPLPMKTSETSDSHEFASSEKQVYTVFDLKDALFSLPLTHWQR